MKKIEGYLDLSDFINLEEVIVFSSNNINANLDVFSHLTKLRVLKLGKNNNFWDSLGALKNCESLNLLDISYQKRITEGLEDLEDSLLFCLSSSLRIECRGTIFYEILEPFDFDLDAWGEARLLSELKKFDLLLPHECLLKSIIVQTFKDENGN